MADPAAIPPPLVLGRCLWAQLTSVGCAYGVVEGRASPRNGTHSKFARWIRGLRPVSPLCFS